MHEVAVPCNCDDIEHCRMERYISDVRIAWMQIEVQRRALQIVVDVATAFHRSATSVREA